MSVNNLSEKIKKINIEGSLQFDISLKEYTTFNTGGTADIFVAASSVEDIIKCRRFARDNNVPFFILGGGANVLVSDYGIRGLTLYTGAMKACCVKGTELITQSGISVNELADKALESELTGLEFIYGMPGTIGGALWMNARCYGSEISEIFQWAEIINENNESERIDFRMSDWAYKLSPFQKRDIIIVRCSLSLKEGETEAIALKMQENYNDRSAKGHFKAPCAGSVFKNNHSFGKPSGQIIDELGLRGYRIGNAAISDFHANIIINQGGAKAGDILALIKLVQNMVREKTGFNLETEIIPVGEWR